MSRKGAAAVVEQHLTPAEVCARLAVSRRTLFSLMVPGRLWPVVRLNARNIRVPASAVNRFLASSSWSPKAVEL
jgi:hypothetical protein